MNSNKSKAYNWLSDQCAALGITPPDHLNTTGQKTRLGVGKKERKGSPVYWAGQAPNGHIYVTIHTFRGGEYKETFTTNGDAPHTIPRPPKPIKKTGIEKQLEIVKANQLLKILMLYINGTDTWDPAIHCKYLANSFYTGIDGQLHNLQSVAHMVMGIRYIGDAIIFPLFNVFGIATAFQVIRGENGRDKKIYGSMKGSSAIIGDPMQALNACNANRILGLRNKLVVTEGVRTGLAAHLLTGGPVICAMSAASLKTAIAPYAKHVQVPIEKGM